MSIIKNMQDIKMAYTPYIKKYEKLINYPTFQDKQFVTGIGENYTIEINNDLAFIDSNNQIQIQEQIIKDTLFGTIDIFIENLMSIFWGVLAIYTIIIIKYIVTKKIGWNHIIHIKEQKIGFVKIDNEEIDIFAWIRLVLMFNVQFRILTYGFYILSLQW